MTPAKALKSVLEENQEWFIGAIIGTDQFLSENEQFCLMKKCENVILEYLNTLPSQRIKQMIDNYQLQLKRQRPPPPTRFDITQTLIDNDGDYYGNSPPRLDDLETKQIDDHCTFKTI